MTDVFVTGPTGEPVKVSAETVAAHPEAYPESSLMSQHQAENLTKQAINKAYAEKELGQVGSGLLSAADTAFLGLPSTIAIKGSEALGDPERAEGIRNLVQGIGQTTGGQIGQAAGLIGPLLMPEEYAVATPLGAIGEAGGAAERLAGRFIPESSGLLGTVGRSAIQMGARGATEGGLIGLSNELNQSAINNAPLTVGSMVSSGLEGGLFGGLALGTMGGLGAGLSYGAEKAAGALAGGSETGINRISKRLGLTDAQANLIKSGEDGGVGWAARVRGGLGEKGFASSDKEIVDASLKASEDASVTRKGILEKLDQESPGKAPSLSRIREAAVTEIASPYEGTPYYRPAVKAIDSVLTSMGEEEQRISLVNKKPIGMTEALNKPISWETLAKTRDILSTEYDSLLNKTANPDVARVLGNGATYKKMIGIFDREMTNAMDSLGDKSLADQYRAVTTKAKESYEIAKVLSQKPAQLPQVPSGALAAGIISGHPISAGMYAVGRYLAKQAVSSMEPYLAEMAYKNMVSQNAAKSVTVLRERINNAVNSFFSKSARPADYALTRQRSKTREKSMSPEEFDKSLERTRELLSDMHRQRVQKYAEHMAQTVHPAMGPAIMDQYDRTAAYLGQNIPAGKKAREAASLRKAPELKALDMKSLKFLNIKKGNDPLSVLDDIESGKVSRDSIKALKFMNPPVHQEIVSAFANRIYEAKVTGEPLPYDKITTLGIVLDSQVDTTQRPAFIAAVQQSFQIQEQPKERPQENNQFNSAELMTPTDKGLVT